MFEWNQIRLKKKLQFGTKMMEEVKLITSKIKDLEAKPDFLSEDEIDRIKLEFKTKIGASKRINEEIATIQKDPNFVNDIDMKDLREKAKKSLPCTFCSSDQSSNKYCTTGHIVCSYCQQNHRSGNACPSCRQPLSNNPLLKTRGTTVLMIVSMLQGTRSLHRFSAIL
jgi:uncharacterized paraquat-inducible protein A